ncbi:MAG: hypothetical protein Q8Q96_01570 [bacterium]|nr:hypothetical protein [bacterium]
MIVIIATLLIVVGGGGFYAGMKYQQSQRGGGNHMGQFQQRAGLGVRPVRGEIISKDSKSITVKLQDGSSKIVFVSEKTAINKAAEGSKDDLKTGEQALIFGTENSDGSVTAQSIQLGSPLRDNFGGSQR